MSQYTKEYLNHITEMLACIDQTQGEKIEQTDQKMGDVIMEGGESFLFLLQPCGNTYARYVSSGGGLCPVQSDSASSHLNQQPPYHSDISHGETARTWHYRIGQCSNQKRGYINYSFSGGAYSDRNGNGCGGQKKGIFVASIINMEFSTKFFLNGI